MSLDRHQLSTEDRDHGQRLLLRFFSINGITVACLMDSVLILYAIRNGMNDAVVAVLASFVQLTMPFMPIGYGLVRVLGLARTWAACWAIRSVFALTVVLAPRLHIQFGQTAATGVILLGMFGFALFKSIGMVTVTPLIGEITTQNERGRFMAEIFLHDNVSYLLATIAAIGVISWMPSISTYQMVIVAGCCAGILGSRVVRRVPESAAPKASAAAPVWDSIRVLRSNRNLRRVIAAWAGGFAGVALVLPVSTITVKNGYGASDSTALILGLIVIVGGIGAARLGSVVSDRSGPRPLLMLYALVLVFSAAFWAVAPSHFSPYLTGLVFLANGLAKGGVIIETGHVLLRETTQEDRVNVSLVTRVATGAVAGLSGSVLAGSLLAALSSQGLVGLPLYRWYFRAVIPLLMVCMVPACRLPSHSGWPVMRLLRTIASPRCVRALVHRARPRHVSNVAQDIEASRGPEGL